MQIEELIKAIDTLNKFENRKEILIQNQSELDLKQQDILHYIENEKFNASDGYKLVKKIKDIRQIRRQVKNELDLINEFQNNSGKLINKNNRVMLIAHLSKINKRLISSEYKYRILDKEKIKEG